MVVTHGANNFAGLVNHGNGLDQRHRDKSIG